MFTIRDFASHGSVWVRMLRHHGAIGLLRTWVTELQEPSVEPPGSS